MCGICGKVTADSQQAINPLLIENMCAVLHHRGPDEAGTHLEPMVGLGHRRLSIIDLSTGQQPMCNQRRDVWITYNGEIYNFPELRTALQHDGFQFHSTSDTEVILHLYEKYGADCVTHLRGMFAFAIWDAPRRRLFLARDRIGKKPLFYCVTAAGIVFASEIKALLQDPTVPRALNTEALYDYLTYQYIPPPATIFQGIHKLPPAHTLIYANGTARSHQYWDLRYVPKITLPEAAIREQVHALVAEAVRIRMISDVPIGAFLSGGVDSSIIVALMAQCGAAAVKTFSIGFQEKDFNELPYARKVAEQFGTQHQEFLVKPDAVDVLPKLIWHFDEPFGDSSAIPTYYVAQMTAQYVKVALNGDGGDESFAGYLRYLGFKIVNYYRLLPHALRKRLLEKMLTPLPLERGRPSPAWLPGVLVTPLRYVKYLNTLSLSTREELYARTVTIFRNDEKHALLSDDMRQRFAAIDSLEYLYHYFQAPNAEQATEHMLYADVMTYLPGDLLVKVDRMTMAHGLEGRSPFLDHKLMEFVAALPVGQKIQGTRLKVLLKKIGQTWFPPKFLERKKQGFGVPIGNWFRHELREMLHDNLQPSALANAGILRQTTIDRILQEHQRGQVSHWHRLWVLLNLELWYRMFL